MRSNQASARLENVGLMRHNVHDRLRWNLDLGLRELVHHSSGQPVIRTLLGATEPRSSFRDSR